MSVFDKVRSNSTTDERRTPGSQAAVETEHVCVFCGRDFDPAETRDCPTCGAELIYRGDR